MSADSKAHDKMHGEMHGKGDMKMDKSHPGFEAVKERIAKRMGVSKKRAGAILGKATRKASAKAKKANPRLLRVKG